MRNSLFLIALLFFATSLFAQNTKTLDDEKLTEFAYKLSELPFSERDVIEHQNRQAKENVPTHLYSLLVALHCLRRRKDVR